MKSKHPQFTPPGPEIDRRADAILGQLSLEEKITLLSGQPKPKQGGDTFGNPRAGIPVLKFADASLGIHWWGPRTTTYPATIALAAAWDRDLAYRMGAAIGRDCRARGIHILLGPGMNIYRSPLCGRNFEYLGEDPYLAAESAVGYVRGLQDQGVCATVKHYAVNYQEWDRHGVSSDLDERTLREVYLPAFRAVIEEAGAGALMTSYNLVNGVHASEHEFLIREVLKGEWGFQGLVMSDWISTYSAVNAANAGLDMEMPVAKWFSRDHLLPAVRNGLVDESVITDKVRRLLRLMLCFGWPDRPQEDTTIPEQDEETAAVSLEVARRGCVLLKNDGDLLPLDPAGIRTLAVIGPFAESTPVNGGGSAYNPPWRTVSILEGLRRQFGAARVQHCAGVPAENSAMTFANSRFETADGQAGLCAEYFNNPDWKGPPVLTRIEPRLEQRWGSGPIVDGVNADSCSIRWTGILRPEKSGTHLVYQFSMAPFRVRINGQTVFDILDGADLKPPRVELTLEAGRGYAIEVWYRSRRDSNAIAVGWEYGDALAERRAAIELARRSDLVIFCGGHSDRTEGEGADRYFAMPAEQEELLLALTEVNPRIVAVITAGGNIDMRRWIDRVPALLYAWYPGQEGGAAIAEILRGKVNPSGKLPATFEHCLEERSSFPCYHDSDGDKRVALTDGVFTGYRHHDRNGVPPRFPFGFGLSYTTFAYENLRLDPVMKPGGTLKVRFDVVNTGKRAGTEVAQLSLSDVEASVPRPVKELKGFATVTLKPGQRKTVTLALKPRHLEFFDLRRRQWVAEPGEYIVRIGASAADMRLTGTFNYR